MVTEKLHEAEANRSPSGEEARRRLLEGLPVTERRLDLAGIDTALLEGGEGPPMVLLHGPGEYAEKWLRVLPGLAATHRVIAPDLPGHGRSATGSEPLDTEPVLRWLGALIAETCSAPPVLVGHVIGGSIAARFAVGHGDRIDRLVLVDSLGLGRFRPAPGFGLALLHFSLRPNERTHDRLWQRCSCRLDSVREQMGERWEAFKAYNVDRGRTKSVKTAVRTLMSKVGVPPIPPEDLERITVPTTLIWGREDLANRLSVAEAASERYGWPLHVIDDSADDPMMDQPEAFLRALRSALGESAASRDGGGRKEAVR